MRKNVLMAILALLTTATIHAQVTRIVADKGLQFEAPLDNNRGLFSSEIDNTLWVSDGTAAGTFQLSPIIQFGDGGGVVNGKFIFVGTTDDTGQELFVTNGTVAGTSLLKDINPGTDDSSPDDDFALLNGFIYFTASRPAEGRELWRTNGTEGGTTLVKDIVAGPTGSNTANRYDLFSNGTFLLLAVNTATEGEELWVSNGTDAGTVPLGDLNPGVPSSNPSQFYKFGNLVLFSATDAQRGTEVWKTDGTPGGTQILKDINAGAGSGINSTNFTFFFTFVFNGRAYFTADDGQRGIELWSTDGTEGNTRILKDINEGAGPGVGFFLGGFPVGNKFIFTAGNSANGMELWESDGTENGTKLFKDVATGPDSSLAIILPPTTYDFNTNTGGYTFFKGNKFFFVATTPEKGTELWISDGTSDGTRMLKDINPGEGSGVALFSFMYTFEAIYFAANDGVHGNELWKSDGTEEGTTMVMNINPTVEDEEDQDSDVRLPSFVINNKIIFSATDGSGDASDLYVVNGSFSPLPVKLGDFTVTPKNGDALLEWTTLSEINTKDFTVQRSEDGLKYTSVGTVAAAGSSSVERRYSFVDAGIMNSGKTMVYYKLAINDKDGHSETTKVISLKLKGTRELSVKLLGNPVQSEIVLMMAGNTTNASISVRDMSGKTYNTRTVKANGQISIPAASLARGMYTVVVETENSRKVLMFMKK